MLSHKGTQVIETKRLILRPFAEADAQAVFNNWASDPQVVRYLTWNVHPSLEFTKEILSIWEAQYMNPKVYNWTIILKEIHQPIGGITVVKMTEEVSNCEIGYCLSKTNWGDGIMSEALKAIIKYLFEEIGFEKITAKHDVQNIGSGKVMMKCGMHFEQCFDEPCAKDSKKICEMASYAIERETYIKAAKIYIDRPTQADVKGLNHFFHKMITYTYASNGIVGFAKELDQEIKTKIDYLKQDFESDGHIRYFLVAKMDEKIVGTIEYGSPNALITACNDETLNNLPEIGSVFVDPDYHNLGIASTMLSAIFDVLTLQGVQSFCLDSGYGMAQKVWRHKFGAPKVMLKDYWGVGLDHMIWQVAIQNVT